MKVIALGSIFGVVVSAVTLTSAAFAGDPDQGKQQPVPVQPPVVVPPAQGQGKPAPVVVPPAQGQGKPAPVVVPPAQGQGKPAPVVVPPAQGQGKPAPVVVPPAQGQGKPAPVVVPPAQGQGKPTPVVVPPAQGQGSDKSAWLQGTYQGTQSNKQLSKNSSSALNESNFRGGCFGGSRCAPYTGLSIPLEQVGGIEYIEFYANDDVGSSYNGSVDVYLDGVLLERNIDIARDGSMHRIDLDGRPGSELRFVSNGNDEVNIERVNVGSY